METTESNENRNKKSKIGFYVEYDWDFNLTHEIVYFLQLMANQFEERLIPYYRERAGYLLQEAERQSEYVDDFPKNDRLCRMKDVAPEMYEKLNTVFDLWDSGAIIDNTGTIRRAQELISRIDGEEV